MLSPYQTIEIILDQLQSEIDTKVENANTHLLRSQSRDIAILSGFTRAQFLKVLSLFRQLNSTSCQFDLIVTMSNVMLMNRQISTFHNELCRSLRDTIPNLYKILDTIVSERKITSESEYSDYLPIFRFYFLILNYSHENSQLLQDLRPSIKKISSKLLNFIAMSSLKSTNLNLIIIETLKILYSYVHLSLMLEYKDLSEDDSTSSEFLDGIDSSFVLGCNKFNLLYSKIILRRPSTDSRDSASDLHRVSATSRSSSMSSTISNISFVSAASSLSTTDSLSDELTFNTYDEILSHFGNVILVIPTSISKNYMLNKVLFTENIIYYLNKYFLDFSLSRRSIGEDDMISKVTSNLLTMDILLSIDDEFEVKRMIHDNLSISDFYNLVSKKSPKYDNLKVVISELAKKVQNKKPTDVFLKETLEDISEKSNLREEAPSNPSVNVTLETGDEIQPNPKQSMTEEDLVEINELFDKIEKNGVFKISMD